MDTPFNTPPPSTPVLRPLTMSDEGISPIMLTDALISLEASYNALNTLEEENKDNASPPSPTTGGSAVSHQLQLYLEKERQKKWGRRLNKINDIESRRKRMRTAMMRMRLSPNPADEKTGQAGSGSGSDSS